MDACADGQAGWQTDGWTDRETDKKAGRQTKQLLIAPKVSVGTVHRQVDGQTDRVACCCSPRTTSVPALSTKSMALWWGFCCHRCSTWSRLSMAQGRSTSSVLVFSNPPFTKAVLSDHTLMLARDSCLVQLNTAMLCIALKVQSLPFAIWLHCNSQAASATLCKARLSHGSSHQAHDCSWQTVWSVHT